MLHMLRIINAASEGVSKPFALLVTIALWLWLAVLALVCELRIHRRYMGGWITVYVNVLGGYHANSHVDSSWATLKSLWNSAPDLKRLQPRRFRLCFDDPAESAQQPQSPSDTLQFSRPFGETCRSSLGFIVCDLPLASNAAENTAQYPEETHRDINAEDVGYADAHSKNQRTKLTFQSPPGLHKLRKESEHAMPHQLAAAAPPPGTTTTAPSPAKSRAADRTTAIVEATLRAWRAHPLIRREGLKVGVFPACMCVVAGPLPHDGPLSHGVALLRVVPRILELGRRGVLRSMVPGVMQVCDPVKREIYFVVPLEGRSDMLPFDPVKEIWKHPLLAYDCD